MVKHIVDVVYEFTIYKASRDFYEKHIKELNDIETGGELTDFLLKNAENPSDVNYYDYYLENLYDYFEDLTRFNRIPFRGCMDECIAKVYFYNCHFQNRTNYKKRPLRFQYLRCLFCQK